ncbi:hypothetical protein D9Q98_001604 [Chlorella vulgaris]|uniref:VTT domain-containing protein n=1 Tax=Chlorella vulgaris TaxID=3077 RepID=A0A9D4YZI0_CHLVU|nr:hypothetical protein D9Q98_001604 [Chlorella vulgaris]
MACRAASCLSQALVASASGRTRACAAQRSALNNCQARGRRSRCLASGRGQQIGVEHGGNEPSTSGCSHLWHEAASSAAAALAAAAVLVPAGAAGASGLGAEAAAPGFLDFTISFIDALGPWGPAAFVATVAIAESIPLFPTQPLSLASGLLFGAQKGSLCMLTGTTLAALLAFQIARGIGRPLAERILNHEMSEGSESEEEAGAAAPTSLVQQKLAEVQAVIEQGSFWQQAGAVLLLRMTPVLPFSASNYLLGLSPMPLGPYLVGSVTGMAFWAVFYASLGGASRSLLLRGVDSDVLLADLLTKAGAYTQELAIGGAVLGGGVLLYLGAGVVREQLAGADGPDAGAPGGDNGGTGSSGSGGGLGRKLGSTLSRGAASSKELGSGMVGELRARKRLVSSRLQGWLGGSNGKE